MSLEFFRFSQNASRSVRFRHHAAHAYDRNRIIAEPKSRREHLLSRLCFLLQESRIPSLPYCNSRGGMRFRRCAGLRDTRAIRTVASAMRASNFLPPFRAQIFGNFTDRGIVKKQDRGYIELILIVDGIGEGCQTDGIKAQIQQDFVRCNVICGELQQLLRNL